MTEYFPEPTPVRDPYVVCPFCQRHLPLEWYATEDGVQDYRIAVHQVLMVSEDGTEQATFCVGSGLPAGVTKGEKP